MRSKTGGQYSNYFNLLAAMEQAPRGPLTRAQAQALMKAICALPEMHLDVKDEGCSIRDLLIQEVLEARGVPHGSLMVSYETGDWNFHFAAFAVLDCGETVVFDPMIFDDVKTESEWRTYWLSRGVKEKAIIKDYGITRRLPIKETLGQLADLARARAAAPAAIAA